MFVGLTILLMMLSFLFSFFLGFINFYVNLTVHDFKGTYMVFKVFQQMISFCNQILDFDIIRFIDIIFVHVSQV